MSRRVCAIFGRADGRKTFAARVVEAAVIGRLKACTLRQCDQCNYQISPTAGTLMHRSRFPLKEWFWAAYLVATHTPGMSATQLRRQMGCSYKILHGFCFSAFAGEWLTQAAVAFAVE